MQPATIVASNEARTDAIQHVLRKQGFEPDAFIEEARRAIAEQWVPQNGARLVARAWSDPDFKQALLADGKAAAEQVGLSFPKHHRHFVVLENTPQVHNLICCTLCSCTAYTIIGLPPDWYKDLEYRARVVRESRTVLGEMGLALSPDTEVRVWDTTADTRYMVLPEQPPHTIGWPVERLAEIITQDGLIGAARL
jgi:nitrile hydratase subunit alpha